MNKREAQRAAKREAREREIDKRIREELVIMLELYMKMHYGNPMTGKMATILHAPVIAKLSAAATLHALLLEEMPEMRR